MELATDRNNAIINLLEGGLLSDSEKEELYNKTTPNIKKLFNQAQEQVQALIDFQKQHNISADVFDKSDFQDVINDVKEDLSDKIREDGKYEGVYLLTSERNKLITEYRSIEAQSYNASPILKTILKMRENLNKYKAQLNIAISAVLNKSIVSADATKSSAIQAEVSDLSTIVRRFNAQSADILMQRTNIKEKILKLKSVASVAKENLQKNHRSIINQEAIIDTAERYADTAEDAYNKILSTHGVSWTHENNISTRITKNVEDNLIDQIQEKDGQFLLTRERDDYIYKLRKIQKGDVNLPEIKKKLLKIK